MKNLFAILTAAMLLLNAATAQNITIPDANFKNALVSSFCVDTDGDTQVDADVDTNNDGEISVAEALSVTRLNVGDRSIASLEGIQYFTNLQGLYCDNNQLTTLNVQGLTNLQGLDCDYNQLTTLNAQGLTNFRYLYCHSNQLTSLNVQDLTNLQTLNCHNNQLTNLFIKNGRTEQIDFYNNPNLAYICCDEAELISIQNYAIQSGLTNCTINSYCSSR